MGKKYNSVRVPREFDDSLNILVNNDIVRKKTNAMRGLANFLEKFGTRQLPANIDFWIRKEMEFFEKARRRRG